MQDINQKLGLIRIESLVFYSKLKLIKMVKFLTILKTSYSQKITGILTRISNILGWFI